jgi:hypothetical protein
VAVSLLLLACQCNAPAYLAQAGNIEPAADCSRLVCLLCCYVPCNIVPAGCVHVQCLQYTYGMARDPRSTQTSNVVTPLNVTVLCLV